MPNPIETFDAQNGVVLRQKSMVKAGKTLDEILKETK